MYPVFLYCGAVFTILILYYFFKPDDDKQQEKIDNLECVLKPTCDYKLDTIRRVRETSRDSSLHSTQNTLKSSVNESSSVYSFSSSSRLQLAVVSPFLATLLKFYRVYLFERILPVLKYLGLNSHWERQDDFVEDYDVLTNRSTQQIEDHFR